METTTLMLLAGAVVGLIAGPLTARSTERRDKTYGGDVARILNLLACIVFVAILPTVLTGVIVGLITKNHAPVLQIGFGMLGIAFLLTLAFSVFEMPARAKVPIASRTALNTWTAEDARNSGL